MYEWRNASKANKTYGGIRMTPELLIGSITLFVLSIFLGFELITKVPATLHTPLTVSYTHLTLPTKRIV